MSDQAGKAASRSSGGQDACLSALLEAASSGDPRAWRGLVDRYTRRLVALVYRQCGDRDLAEEIAQATFVKVADVMTREAASDGNGARYREQGRFEPWLFRIAMNRLRDEMRRRRRQAVAMDMTPGAGAGASGSDRVSAWAAVESGENAVVLGGPSVSEDPAERASRGEQLSILRRAVSELNEADAEIIYLRHTAGLSFPQIAEALDQPLGTVLARGHRALKKLRKIMEKHGLAA